MLVVVHDRVGFDAEVEQLDGAIAAGGKQLILVDLRPCQVVQCVVCVESEEALSTIATREREGTRKWEPMLLSRHSRLLYLDASSRQTKRK